MPGRTLQAVLLGCTAIILSGCFGPTHPDHERYEYLYIKGVLQPPYTSFPSGVERGNWKCYDEDIGKEFDCTFVRGGWNQYHYIYRSRR